MRVTAIRADGVTADHTVTITNTRVSNFQKGWPVRSGRDDDERGGHSTVVGPAVAVPFSNATNGVNYTNTSTNSSPPVGASGTMTGSTIIGSVPARPVQRILQATYRLPCCCSGPTT